MERQLNKQPVYVRMYSSMFCPKCKSLLKLNRKTEQKECKNPNCGGHSESKGKDVITKRKQEDKEIVVTEGIEGTLPTTKIICEKCKHNEATFYLRQTRAADEPTTRFYQCTKCKHRWREY